MFDDHRFTAIERLKHLPEKVRQRGLTWLMGRVAELSISPFIRRACALARSYSFLSPSFFWRRTFQFAGTYVFLLSSFFWRRTFHFVYDLDYMPVSFDAAWYLLRADLQRKKLGREAIHCVFVPVPDDTRSNSALAIRSAADALRVWGINNICVAMSTLLPTVHGFTVCGRREQLDRFGSWSWVDGLSLGRLDQSLAPSGAK